MLEAAARVSGIVSMGSEFAALIWGLVERVRGIVSGGSRDEDNPGGGSGDGGGDSAGGRPGGGR